MSNQVLNTINEVLYLYYRMSDVIMSCFPEYMTAGCVVNIRVRPWCIIIILQFVTSGNTGAIRNMIKKTICINSEASEAAK